MKKSVTICISLNIYISDKEYGDLILVQDIDIENCGREAKNSIRKTTVTIVRRK